MSRNFEDLYQYFYLKAGKEVARLQPQMTSETPIPKFKKKKKNSFRHENIKGF